MYRLFVGIMSCAMLVLMSSSSGCKSKSETTAPAAVQTPPPPAPAAPAAPAYPTAAPALDPTPKNAKVRIRTDYGDMVVRLYDETPLHRDNFLALANSKFYDDLLFHRVINTFMVQGGDPNSRSAPANMQLGMGGPGYTVPGEFNPALIHKKGALCAARQGDAVNPQRNSSGSQFYIVQGTKQTDAQLTQMETYVRRKSPGFAYTDVQKQIYKTQGGTPQLDMDYTVFGEVIEGLAVVDSIAKQSVNGASRPLKDVKMKIEMIK